MKWLVPSFLGLALYILGARHSGPVAGAFLGVLGVAVGLNLGGIIRGRTLRKAPPPPPALPDEHPILHGPLRLLQAQGPDREVWGYLSDRRLSLLPQGDGDGVSLDLATLEEIRPQRARAQRGRLSLVFAGQVWKLHAPDARRWEDALRTASRKNDELSSQ